MTQRMQQATAIAHPNIALVKYWGKRAGAGNLPAAGSLSITLDTLYTRTRVRFARPLREDTLSMGKGPITGKELQRLSAFLDLVRRRVDCQWRAEVHSENNFPTGAGLASSASGFAALALAATSALGITLSPRELSVLARQGSGSAARSLFGGFVLMHASDASDQAYAEPLLDPAGWPLSVVVAITSTAKKSIGSTEGMERTRSTAPYYDAWVKSVDTDLVNAQRAMAARDFTRLAEVAEHSCLKMHAVGMAAQPPLLYWNPSTLAGMQLLQKLRVEQGVPVFFTVDAGPQIKAVCLPEAVLQVQAALREVPGVQQVSVAGLGQGARLLQDGAL